VASDADEAPDLHPDLGRSRSEELFRAVYHELKKVAASKLSREKSPTIQGTDLVHETYLRLKSANSIVHSQSLSSISKA
jgi:DNA-directed RNA polymerase specialized sigma24 family protein